MFILSFLQSVHFGVLVIMTIVIINSYTILDCIIEMKIYIEKMKFKIQIS